ncbi:MAG: ribonuclease J [Ardenticatenaceae bacterium]|nr:ribonuclease J [Ardenticatenaceae bacterium]MCB8990900.1 ribonuclease J [Ardenticatenaceae bacterium]MCB9004967.1 ribonuclease J [Ardenticatenaceae bacterium]
MTSKLRIVPLGGLGEIGKNMTVIEYEDEILVIDAGIMFPESDMLGIDIIIPDFTYLRDKTDKIRAILVTHGHEDHIGALPHFMAEVDAPIYATALTAGLIEVKLRQAGLLSDVDIHTFQAGETLELGCFTVEPFHVAHSIPDCVGFGITTPVGLIVHTGDYKFDHTPADGWPPDFAKLAEFSQRGVLALLADSTNADRPGWTPSEMVVARALDDVFRTAEGRIIIATFASLISRIQQVADLAEKYGRKLAITGRSMRENAKMARRLGYLEIPDHLLIDVDDAVKLPQHEVAIMATGSQGEPSAVMGRLARGRHRNLSILEGDTVVFSAYPIPGNEEVVFRTINQLFRRGANVLYERIAPVHVSGHASQEEMKLMINLVRPQFLIPIHGELRHLKQHAEMALHMDIPQENIAVIENGTPLELTESSLEILPRMPGGYVFVDGASVGEIGWPVVRDREALAQSGVVFAVLATSDAGKIVGQPEIISRGFVNPKESDELLKGAAEAILRAADVYSKMKRDKLNEAIEDALSRYLYAETGRRPLVHVVVK